MLNLAHFTLPVWFIWLASLLGLVTSVITIVQSVRVRRERSRYTSAAAAVGEITCRTFSAAVVLAVTLTVIALCASSVSAGITAFQQVTSTPQVKFDEYSFPCSGAESHLYLKVDNFTQITWHYTIQAPDNDPAGAPWAQIPQFTSGDFGPNDPLTIAVVPSPNLCKNMAQYSTLTFGITVIFSRPAGAGASAGPITRRPTVQITS